MASALRSALGSVSADVKGMHRDISREFKENKHHITGKTSKRQGLYKKHLLDGAELQRLQSPMCGRPLARRRNGPLLPRTAGTRWWGGTFFQDLWVNFKNNHPLFSMCLGACFLARSHAAPAMLCTSCHRPPQAPPELG